MQRRAHDGLIDEVRELGSMVVYAGPAPAPYQNFKLIEDKKSAVNQDAKLRRMNARSYYRWIWALLDDKIVEIKHTKGHTDELTIPSLMNYEADYYASAAQRMSKSIPTAPIPTFYMDDYTFYSRRDGWIESNIRHFVDMVIAQNESDDIAREHPQWMLTSIYEHRPPPDFPYTRAYAAHSAAVQLYARSGQLPVAATMYKRKKSNDEGCIFGCNAIEDAHHIFVECRRYREWRTKATEDVVMKTTMKLDEKGVEETARNCLLKAAKFLFARKDDIWPLKHTFYYLGHIPPLEGLLPINAMDNVVSREQLLHHFAAEWHLKAIRLAGRIFGDYQREMSKRNAPMKIRGKR
ncbi:hypothetical protein DFH09DRAFT_1093520 [Mycena vulgaris]|nr:hypothetical protein DFH09DRAFT_1093520 [Mycena vulgaris]